MLLILKFSDVKFLHSRTFQFAQPLKTFFYKKNVFFFVTVDLYNGSALHFWRVERKQMGAYLCIASNDVPPAVSKRVILNVNCKSFYCSLYFFQFKKKTLEIGKSAWEICLIFQFFNEEISFL